MRSLQHAMIWGSEVPARASAGAVLRQICILLLLNFIPTILIPVLAVDYFHWVSPPEGILLGGRIAIFLTMNEILWQVQVIGQREAHELSIWGTEIAFETRLSNIRGVVWGRF